MKDIIDEVIEHAKDKFPEEICGVIGVLKGKNKYIKCNNISPEKEKYFIIDPIDYMKAEDSMEITHIVHSHPTVNPNPSQADLVAIEKSGLPWLIVNPLTKEHTLTEPSGYTAPIVGREFSFGVLDCYSIVRDYYKTELNIELIDGERADKFWERGENLYVDNFEKEGFVKIDFDGIKDLKTNDVILMSIASPLPNHAAVYLGDGKIIHHMQNRLSSLDMYGGYWLKNTWGVIRHKDFI